MTNYQKAENYETLVNREVRITQHNNIDIIGKVTEVVYDRNRLDKINIEQHILCPEFVGRIMKDTKPMVATVYVRNIGAIDVLDE